MATGRSPKVGGLGLEEVGVQLGEWTRPLPASCQPNWSSSSSTPAPDSCCQLPVVRFPHGVLDNCKEH
jgi:hypothetical protein